MIRSLNSINTISDMVEYGKNLEISHAKLNIKAKVSNNIRDGIIVNFSSILLKYQDYLKDYIVDVIFNNEEYAKYKFQPKLLSQELYGTTEMWSSILMINNIYSCSEFNLKKLKLFRSDIFDFINEVLVLEDSAIKRNNAEIQ